MVYQVWSRWWSNWMTFFLFQQSEVWSQRSISFPQKWLSQIERVSFSRFLSSWCHEVLLNFEVHDIMKRDHVTNPAMVGGKIRTKFWKIRTMDFLLKYWSESNESYTKLFVLLIPIHRYLYKANKPSGSKKIKKIL